IAGGPVRIIMELAGVKDILTKSLGSANALNIVNATISGLNMLKTPDQIASIRKTEQEIN
ncbi:MAG: 30S ribosomal protein S5, partial [Candidatus Hydromicrobium sp.]